MKQRILSAAVIIIVLAGLLYLHSWFLVGAIVLLSLVVQYEMIKAFKQAGVKLVSPILYAFALLTMPIYYFYGLPAVFVLQMFAVCLIFVAATLFRKTLNFDSIMYAELTKRAIRYYLIKGRTVDTVTLRTTFAEACAELLSDRRFYLCIKVCL